jgi:hypothetical protein
MKLFRRLGFALWLAFALVAGQHAAALHLLGHATESLSHKQDPKQPAQSKCGECFVCSQLGAGAATTIPEVPLVACGVASAAVEPGGAHAASILAYLSRGPPALL